MEGERERERGRELHTRTVHPPTTDSTGRHQWICNRKERERVWASDSFDLYIPPCLAGMKGEGGRAREGAGGVVAWHCNQKEREGGEKF